MCVVGTGICFSCADVRLLWLVESWNTWHTVTKERRDWRTVGVVNCRGNLVLYPEVWLPNQLPKKAVYVYRASTSAIQLQGSTRDIQFEVVHSSLLLTCLYVDYCSCAVTSNDVRDIMCIDFLKNWNVIPPHPPPAKQEYLPAENKDGGQGVHLPSILTGEVSSPFVFDSAKWSKTKNQRMGIYGYLFSLSKKRHSPSLPNNDIFKFGNKLSDPNQSFCCSKTITEVNMPQVNRLLLEPTQKGIDD